MKKTASCFMNKNTKIPALVSAIKGTVTNVPTLTENGALTNSSTSDAVLDFFALAGAMRSRSDSDVEGLFEKAYYANPNLATKAAFYFRDCRGGQGERKVFRTCLKWLANNHPQTVENNLLNVPVFGRWDDLFILLGTSLEDKVLESVKKQLSADLKMLKDGKSISLAAKWLPSINTSSAESRSQARKLATYLKWTDRKYRKTLSQLRSHLNLVEKSMTNREWSNIDYSKVPSRASTIYRKAFAKHDKSGYEQWQSDVKTGKNGAKVNASVLYPYDIASRLKNPRPYGGEMFNHDETLELQWKALPDYLEGKDENAIAVVDVSGSMYSQIAGTSVSALDVSTSLGLYFAERSKGLFHNYYITFTDDACLAKVSGKNTAERLTNMCKNAGYSTNIQAAFNTILNAAVKNKIPKKEMPTSVFVISDMEFNCCSYSETNFQQIERKYAAAGYPLPRIVFWNVMARQNQVPITKFDKGLMVSGLSPSIVKNILNNVIKTPYDLMLETLLAERYKSVSA